jgi:uncharacterized membrane protein YdjX (TVP38/TMEM64 family)
MKQLLTIALILASAFASTFIVIKATGILTIEDIKNWLAIASEINPAYVALTVIILLFADLFIAVPTLTICILSGYFLGWSMGGLASTAGMMLAGVIGYWICWAIGPKLLMRIYKDPIKLAEMQDIFSEHSTSVILMCRAMPILPEVVSCMAGANKMAFVRFIAYYSISTIPYAFIAAYAGSESSLTNPMPAIFTAIGISLTLWFSWFIFLRRNYPRSKNDPKSGNYPKSDLIQQNQ